MMLNLTNKQWGRFRIGDVFNINTGANIPSKELKDGFIPRITAKDTNNGIDQFTIRLDVRNYRTNRKCVSVSFLGSCFYQDKESSFDMKIHSITPKDNIDFNRYIGLFVVNQCRKQFVKFSYGNQLSSTDLPKQYITLPVTSEGHPDWQFMEEYMRSKEKQILKPTIERLCKQLIDRELQGGGIPSCNWKEFIFGKEFSIESTQSGIDKNKLIQQNGRIPYVTRTDVANGIDMFVCEQSNKYKVDEGNVITIGLDTQTVFYQPNSFYTGQNIQVIRHKNLDRYNAQFLIVAIKKLVSKFSWGSYGATLTRLRKSKIYLPVNSNDEIDFQFMSSFMRQIETDILGTTLSVFKNRLSDNNQNISKLGGGRLEDI